MCSPELVPQIVGGVEPPGFVTANTSVKHRVESAAGIALALASLAGEPFSSLVTSVVAVSGPAMTNVLKSSLSCRKKS